MQSRIKNKKINAVSEGKQRETQYIIIKLLKYMNCVGLINVHDIRLQLLFSVIVFLGNDFPRPCSLSVQMWIIGILSGF